MQTEKRPARLSIIFGKISQVSQRLPAKLSRPRMNGVYPRRRLFYALSAAGAYAAVWIHGPAGSGKTTAVNSYLEDRRLPCLWYTLDEGDADIASFFYYLRRAAKAYCRRGADLPPPFTPDFFPSIAIFAKRFFEAFFALFPAPFCLVFDDYHEVSEDSSLHEVLGNAISQTPNAIHLYVISRKEPPPELARSRANGDLFILGWEHLRLTLEEAGAIARTAAIGEMKQETIAELHTKTDGWVAGLLLLLKRGEFEGIEPQLLSKHTPQEIFDYFGAELFDKLPPHVQKQLLRFAFLPKISIGAANRVSPDNDAQRLLQRLHRGNAFLSRMMGDEISYRFHPLLQAFLKFRARRTLDTMELKDLLQLSADILVGEGNMEAAVRLYIIGGKVSSALALILAQAPELASHGRFRTLDKLICSLPESLIDNSPWLTYWQAACRLPYAVRQGGDLPKNGILGESFTKALTMFEEQSDPVGSYLALAGILESKSMELNAFAELDPWIDKYDAFRARWGFDHPPEVVPWLAPALISALVLRNPYHPALPEWIEKGLDVFKTTPESAVAMRILPPTIFLYLLQGDLISAENLINEFKQSVNERTSPMGTLIFCSVYAFYCWSAGRFEHCLEIADTALELQRQTGIDVNFPQCHFAVGALNTGDVELAEKMLLRVAPSLLSYGYWSKAFYHVVAGWIALIKKDTLRLKCHAMDGLRAGERAGCPMTLPVENLLCALGYHVGGEKEYADFHLKKALNLSRRFQVRQVEFSCLLVLAEFALASGNHGKLTRALRASFELGRTYDYVTAYFWRPDVMAELCVQALQHDIEVKYARKLVKYRRLSPRKPPRNIANWPWPFKFRTLGGFSLEIDGEPVTFNGKAQHRPLSVLKYIVAKGGREVPVTRLQDDLWPDFDGDRAVMAFKAALNRLRKLLGNKAAILRNAGSLSFNEQQCWTDTWAFEYVTGEVESFLDRPDSPRQAEHLLDRLLTLYRGPFLPDEQVPWAIQVRHGLALRFVDLVQRLALVIVDAGNTECAIAILNKALPMAPVEASANKSMIELLQNTGMMPQATLLIEHAPRAMLG